MKKTNRISLEQVGALSDLFSFDLVINGRGTIGLSPSNVGSVNSKSGPTGFRIDVEKRILFASGFDLEVDNLSDAGLLHEIVHIIAQPPWLKEIKDIKDEGFLLLPFELALAKQLFKKNSPAMEGVKYYQGETCIGPSGDICVNEFDPWWKTEWFLHGVSCLKKWGVMNDSGVIMAPWPWGVITEKKWNKEFEKFNKILEMEY